VSALPCDDVRELAPDLALVLLTGEERAAVIAHLERCESCRAEVASLAVAADEVLLVSPEAAPPDGFAERVIARIATEVEGAPTPGIAGVVAAPEGAGTRTADGGPPPARRLGARRRARAERRGRRTRRVALGTLAAAAVTVVVAGIAAVMGEESQVDAATAEMRTGRGRVVGDAAVTGDGPATVVVDVPEWAALVERWGTPEGGYWLAVEEDDGTRTLRPIPDEVHDWTVHVEAPAADVASVSMLDAEGRVWCTGRFTS
jgi:hypothetical protein